MLKGFFIIVISLLLRVLNIVLWAYCILSWIGMINPKLYNIYMWLDGYMKPIMAPFRKLCMPLTMRTGVDFSPLILVLVVSYVARILLTFIVAL